MGQVSVTIHNQRYQLACRDGEEARLETLAAFVDDKVTTLKQSLGNVGDSRLFLMAALLIADELMEVKDRLPANGTAGQLGAEEAQNLAQRLAELVTEIESIAGRLDKA